MTLTHERRLALVAGLALLLMSVLAAVAILGVVDPIVASDDIETAIDDAGSRFGWAVAGLVAIAVLDLVIAWALWRLFAPVDGRLAGLAGAARAAYAVVYLVAIGYLATGESANVERYQELWDLGLLVFGVHLVLVGLLCWRSELVPRVIGVLVVIAGVGYLVDSVGVLVSSSYDVELAAFLFVGEVALMVWLLWWGTRSRRAVARPPSAGSTTPAPRP
jgi:hypothetical protein